MSKKQKFTGLPPNTKIEVIAKGPDGQIYKTIKTIEQANAMKKKDGFIYSYFQVDFSAYKNAKIIK